MVTYTLLPRCHLKDLIGEENCRATCTATNELICFLPNKQFISFVSNGDKGLWVKVQLEETFKKLPINGHSWVFETAGDNH